MDREEGVSQESGSDDDDDNDDDLDRLAVAVGLYTRRFKFSCLLLFEILFLDDDNDDDDVVVVVVVVAVVVMDEAEGDAEKEVVTPVEVDGLCEGVSLPAHWR